MRRARLLVLDARRERFAPEHYTNRQMIFYRTRYLHIAFTVLGGCAAEPSWNTLAEERLLFFIINVAKDDRLADWLFGRERDRMNERGMLQVIGWMMDELLLPFRSKAQVARLLTGAGCLHEIRRESSVVKTLKLPLTSAKKDMLRKSYQKK